MSEPVRPPASLVALQRWMLDALVDPRGVEAEALARWLRPGPQLGAAARLAIYQRSYLVRLTKCMCEQFPALCHALGEAPFSELAGDYLRAHPSEDPSLHALGRRFPAWLEASRPDRERPASEREDWIDFMVDLADYERTLYGLFDAPGHEGAPWPGPEVEDGRLVLQPCFALAEHRYPVAWYYHEVRAGRSPAFPPRRVSHVAIARRDYLTSTFPLRPLQFGFLQLLQRGRSIAEALAEVAAEQQQRVEEVERSWAAEVRTAWIAAGFFIERARA